MGLSKKSNYEKKKIVSCFDIGEVPRSPGKWNWNWPYLLPFIFTFEQGDGGFVIFFKYVIRKRTNYLGISTYKLSRILIVESADFN